MIQKHRLMGDMKTSSPSSHTVSSSQLLSAEAGCVSDPVTLSHIDCVYPSNAAPAFSLAVSCAQDLYPANGCRSCPDSLSHDSFVYPNATAPACSLSQADGTVRMLM